MDDKNEESKLSASTEIPAQIDEVPNESFGDWLLAHRVSRRISLEEIAAVTKVHIMQLKALEKNEVSKLPAPAFVRGFLVSYSRHLGIDENEVLNRYKSSFGGSLTPIADILTPSQNKSARSASAPKVTMVSSPHLRHAPGTREIESSGSSALNFKNVALTTGLIGIIVLVGTLIGLGKKAKLKDAADPALQSTVETPATMPTIASNPSQPAAPAVAPILTAPVATPVVAAPLIPSTTPIAAAAVTPNPVAVVKKEHQLEIKAIEANYVHLRVDEGAPKGVTLKAAQSQIIEVSKKAVLTVSDAGNLEIRWDGVWYSALGYRGDLRVITLPDQISILTPKNSAPKVAPKPKPKPAEIPTAEPRE